MKNNNRKTVCLITLALTLVLGSCSSGAAYAGYQAEDVSGTVAEANRLFQEEKYEDSLQKYLDAMEGDVKNMEARFGAVRCHMELGNYGFAADGLSLAAQIAPYETDIYALYLELSERTGNISYAMTATNLANRYQVEEFVKKIPAKPAFSEDGGKYDQPLSVRLTSAEAVDEIRFSIRNEDLSVGGNDLLYTGQVPVVRGKTILSAYVVRDGIPSETASVEYQLAYDEKPVTFTEPAIEAAVRSSVNKKSPEVLTETDLLSVQSLRLYISYNNSEKVQSLEDLKQMPYITYVDLEGQDQITDYSPLAQCTLLSNMDISRCSLDHLTFLQYTPNLTSLTISRNLISDLTPVTALKRLRYLYAFSNEATDSGFLKELPGLYTISIDAGALQDYGVLEEVKSLNNLQIYGIEGINRQAIASLKNVTTLNLLFDSWKPGDGYAYGNERPELNDLAFLEDMTQLTSLQLNCLKNPEELAHLEKLKNLQSLYLYNCEATEDEAWMERLRKALPNCTIYD